MSVDRATDEITVESSKRIHWSWLGLWAFLTTFAVFEDWEVRGTAAVGSDGTVYFGSNDGWLYAVDSEGGEVWSEEIDTLVTPGSSDARQSRRFK